MARVSWTKLRYSFIIALFHSGNSLRTSLKGTVVVWRTSPWPCMDSSVTCNPHNRTVCLFCSSLMVARSCSNHSLCLVIHCISHPHNSPKLRVVGTTSKRDFKLVTALVCIQFIPCSKTSSRSVLTTFPIFSSQHIAFTALLPSFPVSSPNNSSNSWRSLSPNSLCFFSSNGRFSRSDPKGSPPRPTVAMEA